jgi:hypothetical protein
MPAIDLYLIVFVECEIESSSLVELNIDTAFFFQSGGELGIQVSALAE